MSVNDISSYSLNKARWILADAPLSDIEDIARRFDLPEIVARLLCARGIAKEDVGSFLKPTLKDDFPDPFSLKGMGDMAEDVAIAIEEGKSFAIFGDFDVDGATSSAVMYRFLKGVGIEAPIYIPDRLSEGYGPNIEALQKLKDEGAEILFMLDCGTTAFDIVKSGGDLGLRIIILDHHEAEEGLPECWHVINPKRKDDSSGLDMLAAVGVSFLACVAINNRLRDRGFFENNGIDEPNLRGMLDIVALGTVCDMVPLTNVNRLFVRFGFAVPYEKMNIGIRALMGVSKVCAPLSTYDCGFVLGPCINAGSRVHKPDLGAKLLSFDDEQECRNIAWMLFDCNEKRKSIQADMEEQALRMVQDKGLEDDALILVDDEGWHPGLSGLVAGRLKERYNKPACVVTYAHDLSGRKEGRGSGRSIPGIHIAQSFIDAR
ncbi:MAG: DHH family phosphoesterase, partial [Alphaproteobacteria bacterium]|nr:DHH family phosphoesterase [Alphaproteobacteria bacterium]